MSGRVNGVGLAMVGVLSVAAIGAKAADLPARKPGLWGVVGTSGPGGQMHLDVRTCVGPDTDKGDAMLTGGRRPPGCETPAQITRLPGGGVAFHTVCRPPGSGMSVDTRGTATGDFASAYVIKATTRMTPPPMPNMAEVSTTMSARFIGACPAGMKPGQSTVNGRPVPAPSR